MLLDDNVVAQRETKTGSFAGGLRRFLHLGEMPASSNLAATFLDGEKPPPAGDALERESPHIVWTYLVLIVWILYVAMQIIAGALARMRA